MDFAYFEAGKPVGEHRLALAPLVAQWRALFRDDLEDKAGTFAPSGVMLAAMMRGYTEILACRVPGNVHAGQAVKWGMPAPVEADVIVRLTCAEKALRKDRRWLSFHLTIEGISGDGVPGARHLSADMRFLWAA